MYEGVTMTDTLSTSKEAQETQQCHRTVVAVYRTFQFIFPLVSLGFQIYPVWSLVDDCLSWPEWLIGHHMRNFFKTIRIITIGLLVSRCLLLYVPHICLINYPCRSSTSSRCQKFVLWWKCQLPRLEQTYRGVSAFCGLFYLLADATYTYLYAFRNCIRIGTGRSIVRTITDEFLARGQKKILFPTLALVSIFADGASTFAKSPTPSTRGEYAVLMHFWHVLMAITAPMSLLVSITSFLLYWDGIALVTALDHTCPDIPFTIAMKTYSRSVLHSTVVFPNETTPFMVDKILESVHSYRIADRGKSLTPCSNTSIWEGTTIIRDSECDVLRYEINSAQSNGDYTGYLSATSGTVMTWGCDDTVKLRIRPGIECHRRMFVQLNHMASMDFNYDYVYKLPSEESLAAENMTDQWHRVSTYKEFPTTIVEANNQSVVQFRRFFNETDAELAHFNFNVSSDLEPSILHVHCNRSCFCYECMTGKWATYEFQPHCRYICPNRSSELFSSFPKIQFCNRSNPDRCRYEWISALQTAHQMGISFVRLASYQSLPNVTAWVDGYSIPAGFNPKLDMPPPGADHVTKTGIFSFAVWLISVFIVGITIMIGIIWHCANDFQILKITFFQALMCLSLWLTNIVERFRANRGQRDPLLPHEEVGNYEDTTGQTAQECHSSTLAENVQLRARGPTKNMHVDGLIHINMAQTQSSFA